MVLVEGSETAKALRCPDCGEYFYAAHRSMAAFGCHMPADINTALDLVLGMTPQEDEVHRERLDAIQKRADWERALFEEMRS